MSMLAADFVIVDRLLPLQRDQPVDEGLAEFFLHMRMFFGIDQDDSVLVEQPVVALDRDAKPGFVLERDPAAAVNERKGLFIAASLLP